MKLLPLDLLKKTCDRVSLSGYAKAILSNEDKLLVYQFFMEFEKGSSIKQLSVISLRNYFWDYLKKISFYVAVLQFDLKISIVKIED